jgi:hypothetical protein
LVACAHVLLHAGFDVEVDATDHVTGDVVLLQFLQEVLGDELATRRRR